MELNLRAIADNARRAETETLLDRVTVYRADMEPVALDLMEAELSRRGISPARIAEHEDLRRSEGVVFANGATARCSYCEKPAVKRSWGWHRLAGRLPVFPWIFNYCGEHTPNEASPTVDDAP